MIRNCIFFVKCKINNLKWAIKKSYMTEQQIMEHCAEATSSFIRASLRQPGFLYTTFTNQIKIQNGEFTPLLCHGCGENTMNLKRFQLKFWSNERGYKCEKCKAKIWYNIAKMQSQTMG